MRRRRVVPAQELIDWAKNRRPQMPHIGRDWFYICTKKEGRIVLLGPYNTAQEAEELAVEKLNTSYEVLSLATRDRAAATQQVKHKILRGDGGNLDTALQRMRHTI